MKFCLMINSSEQWYTAVEQAFCLAETMTSKGHVVNAVLFYGQAIKVIQASEQLKLWQQWQRNTGTPLLLCSTLLENNQLSALAVQTDCFEVVNLGSWVQAIETAEKTVELG